MKLLDTIGVTPLVELEHVYIKLECSNPGGSVKDRIARFMLLEARRRGELRTGDVIVEATSGNTGIAMAMVGRELGHHVIIYMPEHMSAERQDYIRAFGAELRTTPREQGFEGPIATRDTFKGRAGYYVPDQFANPDNARCHRETTGAELLAQTARARRSTPRRVRRGRGHRRHVDGRWRGAARGLSRTALDRGRAERVQRDVRPARGRAHDPRHRRRIHSAAGGHGRRSIEVIDGAVGARGTRWRARLHERHGHCVGMSSGAKLAAARTPASSAGCAWPRSSPTAPTATARWACRARCPTRSVAPSARRARRGGRRSFPARSRASRAPVRSRAMREVRILLATEVRRVPWRNGRGFTDELALAPDGASFERGDFHWRVSRAAIDSIRMAVLELRGFRACARAARWRRPVARPRHSCAACAAPHG
jgi:cysteine synthase